MIHNRVHFRVVGGDVLASKTYKDIVREQKGAQRERCDADEEKLRQLHDECDRCERDADGKKIKLYACDPSVDHLTEHRNAVDACAGGIFVVPHEEGDDLVHLADDEG